ncbi:MAG: secretin and TonB N-terminal domain-containing protein [Armatimonadota bacterium]|jgi:type II secretory pathway component GspD/PulD (secretin)
MQANAFAAKSKTRRIGALISLQGIIITMLALLIVSQAAAVNITGVNVANKPDRAIVSVQGDAPLKMGVISSSSGRFIAFQFAGQLNVEGRMVSIQSGKIHNVRYSRFQEKPPAARIVFNTASNLDYSTSWNDDRTRVEISVWKFGATPKAETAAPNIPAAPAVEVSSVPSKAVLAKEPPMAIPVAVESIQAIEAAMRPAVAVNAAAPVAQQVAFVNHQPAAPVAKPASVPASMGAGRTVSLNFLGADIEDVLKAISVQSKENIVVGSDVAGKITVTLKDVTVEQALDYITQLSGFTYVKTQQTYLVGSLNSIGGFADSQVEIVTLTYANADDVLGMLKVRCPHVRSSKISVLGGKARKHEIATKSAVKSDANIKGESESKGAPSSGNIEAADGQADFGEQANIQPATGATANVNTGGAVSTEEILSSTSATDSPSSNLIILSGTQDRIDAAKEFIAQVEETMKNQSEDKKISLYPVKHVNTVELANTLMSVVMGVNVLLAPSDALAGMPSSDNSKHKLIPASAISGENTVRQFDTQSGNFSHTLIIVGKADDVQKALDTAAQFDVPGDFELATYKLKYVGLKNVVAALRKLTPGVVLESAGLDPSEDSGSGGSSPAGGGAGGKSDDDLREAGKDQTNVKQQGAMNAQAVDSLSRLLVLQGRKYDVKKALSIIEMLDVKSPQIKIEAKFTALSETGEKNLGVSWNWGEFSKVEVSRNRWHREPVDFGAKLDALIASGDGTLLASPSLICLEGKPGQFFVGDEIRYITQISVATNGAPTVTTDTANVGVQLSVVGAVTDDGDITLNLHPEVSTLKLDTSMRSEAGITLPVITRRFTDHVLRVKNGETIVIGGLILDSELDSLSKIPVLGDIPLFGHLFRHRNKTKERSEVVVFITASIVQD